MRQGLMEPLVLVRAQTTSPDWPLLYANKAWNDMTGVEIVPPDRLPGFAHASGAGLAAMSMPAGRKDIRLFDWLTLTGKTQEQLRKEMRVHWSQSEPSPFVLKGRGHVVDSATPVTFTCRFMPAELPVDAAAAAIRPVPLRSPGERLTGIPGMPGRLYFVTMVRTREATEAPRPSLGRQLTPISEDDNAAMGSANKIRTGSEESVGIRSGSGHMSAESTPTGSESQAKRKGNTVDALASIKPPRSPFEEVRLMRLVGQGSFGKVLYGLWMGSPVAVKVIETNNSEQRRKFEPAFEAVLSATMAHPNLVQTYMSSARDKPMAEVQMSTMVETWMVQEWCDLGTLANLCKKPRSDAECVPEVVDMNVDICRGGCYLHSRGIIHGDLTANNVLVKTQVSRKGYICKICDFGLARVLEGDTTDIMTTQLGTVTHMPPELFGFGTEVRLTCMADVYAAGILLWQAVMGKAPFADLTPPQVVVQIVKGRRLELPTTVAEEIRTIFSNCTNPDPHERPTFEELVKQFSALAASPSA